MIRVRHRCPHCRAFGEVELADDVLPSDREREYQGLRESGDQVEVDDRPPVLVGPVPTSCEHCGASFVLAFKVQEQPYVAVAPRSELVDIQGMGSRAATGIRRFLRRTNRETPPPVACAGCCREFGEAAGYPAPLPATGLCAVCSQELRRRLGRRGA